MPEIEAGEPLNQAIRGCLWFRRICRFVATLKRDGRVGRTYRQTDRHWCNVMPTKYAFSVSRSAYSLFQDIEVDSGHAKMRYQPGNILEQACKTYFVLSTRYGPS
jgi:hypothetical protein